ncbi:ABC transporter ATP-binding protein [Algibacter lectus]|uniref:Lipopolysaccharide transport system ATP-binding protein n=1 Tax=Algibacter lectus TaxID=221126 RepID=A0A4R8MFR5_9FLAO|nr:ABC transporter ATP-binding protein [Algibacter lectus]MWW24820.1 ATP-binding cassette domain-containing protein [Algibacter lectus]TDY64769.1 lipopolysaccharide transport system ATP-binding protein [Algibacter lectus]
MVDSQDVILKAQNISKQYRLGLVGTGTISHDLNRWWNRIRGKEDPYLKVGESNDRSTKGSSEYVWALKDINFEVKRGEVLGIIGKNGAGKSTLLKILSKVTGPTTGEIKTRGRIASLLEVGTGFHGEMTGRENIFLNGAILGMTKKEITAKIDEIIDFSGCQRYIDTPVKRYSSGMTVRLAFAVAAFLEPEILVIDEVLAVGDAEFQKKAIGKMQDISRGEGRTVLFVSHNLMAVQALCTRAIVLEHGNIVFEGNTKDGVSFYLSKTKKIARFESVLNESNRRWKTSGEVELIKIVSTAREVNIRSQLKFDVFLKTNKKIEGLVSLSGTICNKKDVALGSFFTKPFDIDKSDNMKIGFSITNHNLAVGDYYLNISISKGSIYTSDLEDLDHAYEAIGFEVLSETKNNDYIIKWNSDWGDVFFDSNIEGVRNI